MLNEKQGYMRDKMKKWFAAWCGLTAACAMTTSCSMMQDDLDDCPTGLYLSFKYDYNLQRADMFNDHVGAVTVYVFDEEGRYVTKQEEANVPGHAPLSSPLYTMRMNLAPGKYKFLVLAGQKDYEAQLAGGGARFVRREPGAGDAMEGALDVTLDRVAGASGWEVAHGGLPLDTLWHGMELSAAEVFEGKPTYDTISLVRDTKHINVSLREIDDPTQMDVANYEFRIPKDAAGMVLTDDNFATIVKAVKNGRNVYANIKRAIQFLLSGNTAGILTVLYASLMGLPVPFAAVHLLFINLLTDSLPAIALGMEPHTNEVMSEKPRPRNEGILTKPFLYSVGVEGLVIAAATVTAFYLGLNAGGAAAGQTMAFSTLCLSRLFHGFSCKSQHPVLLTRHFWNNRALLGAFTIGALLLGLVLLVPALEPLFAVAPLSIGMVGAIVGLAFGSMLVIQLLKWIRR